jgi:putative flippase GtrA
MDGDLQHPPELVPVLHQTALAKRSDLVVATRRSEDSQVVGLNMARNLISKGLDRIARVFFPSELRGVSDPLTGFFLVKVKSLKLNELRPKGFKILLEILVRHPHLRRAEMPFRFGERHAGQSKASAAEVFKYFSLLWALRFGEESLRFIGFAMVGLSGIFVNSAAIYMATERLNIHYMISAWLATLVSTLWNFGLTETWVYRAKDRNKGRMWRLGIFFGMNSLALLLRAPMIYFMTATLGFYYVLSNLISLAILTVTRFALADKIIWSQTPSSSPVDNPELTVWRPLMKKSYSYNIHNIVTVVSEGELPELEPFQVEAELANPTIHVKIGTPRSPKAQNSQNYMRYRELFGPLGFEVGIEMGEQVRVTASPALRLSPHVLYTNVIEPLLRWTFVKKGYALVHGATIAFGDQAYMITARTDTGKTTTLLKMLAYQRRNSDQAAFLSDDMTIVSPDGVALTYPKPLTISYHTLRAVNADTLTFKERLTLGFQSRIHSRSGRRAAFVISKTHLPAATINTFVQMLIPPPKYFVNKLIPKVKVARKANLNGMFIIERGDEEIVPMKNTEAMEVLLQNCEDAYGFPPYNDIKEFLYSQDGTDLREREHAIIHQALGNLPATVIRSSNLDWWSQIPSFVNDEQVTRDFARALEKEAMPRSRARRESEAVSV